MNNFFKVSIFLVVGLLSGCSSDDDNTTPDQGGTAIDLNEAKLNDFKLSEVTNKDVKIEQPEIVEGKEKMPGTIVITVPETTDVLNLSLASVNFDESKFEIAPKVGEAQSFEVGTVITYTIKSKVDPEKSIRYLVSVIKESTTPGTDGLKITGFKFEQSKNGALRQDIEAKKIAEYQNKQGVIYILVPQGTDISKLVPTINFEGESLAYSQRNAAYREYPETGLEVDFTSDYSITGFEDKNVFLLEISNGTEKRGYQVILDFENAIEFEQTKASTPDVRKGNARIFTMLKWTNKGNHNILYNIKGREYIDKTVDNKGNIYEVGLTPAEIIQGNYIRPGEEGKVIVKVTAEEIGDYEIDVVLHPKYDLARAQITDNDLVDLTNIFEDLFGPITLNIKTKVVD